MREPEPDQAAKLLDVGQGAPPGRALSWLPRPLQLQTAGRIRYLMDASFCSLPLYFALKGKHEYVLTNAAPFVEAVRGQVAAVAAEYDLVAFPESRFPFLRQVTAGVPHAVEMRKRAKAEVFERALAGHKWSKLERESQARAGAEMGEAFTINLIKSNQRHRYAPHLFQELTSASGSRVLLLDDFIMSGMTLLALEAALGRSGCDAFGVFFQLGLHDALAGAHP